MNESSFNKMLSVHRGKYEDLLSVAKDGIYLYGAGFVGGWAVEYLEQLGFPVLGFIDTDEQKNGQILAGKPIHCLADLSAAQAKRIVISSRHAVLAIRKRLEGLTTNTISVDAFVVQHEFPKWGQQLVDWLSHDDKSLGTLWAVLISMLEGRTQALSSFADPRPFFDRYGFFNRDGEVFIDAGAYVGDSLERFIWSVNGVFREIHAFEPGEIQFSALERRVSRLRDEWALAPDNIYLVNKGLSSTSRKVCVSESSHLIQTRLRLDHDVCSIDNAETNHVSTVSLDEYLNGKSVSLIKVDVEGSEAELIVGAQNSIIMNRPRMALSVYHYPTDIFYLPDQVMKINPDYKLTLGHHSSQLMDTIIYCRDKND